MAILQAASEVKTVITDLSASCWQRV